MKRGLQACPSDEAEMMVSLRRVGIHAAAASTYSARKDHCGCDSTAYDDMRRASGKDNFSNLKATHKPHVE